MNFLNTNCYFNVLRKFINKNNNDMNYKDTSEEQWLTRDIIPVDPSDFKTWAIALFKAVRDREKK